MDKSLALFSLPRSGSTYLSSEITTRTNKLLINEFLRRSFRKNFSNPINASNVIFNQEAYLENLEYLDPRERLIIENFFQNINSGSFIIKETDAIFQILALKSLLQNTTFFALTRHILGVLNSYIKIENIRERRKYHNRVKTTYIGLTNHLYIDRFRGYIDIYKRAQETEIMGRQRFSLLVAHLAIQALELNYLIKNGIIGEIKYEDLKDKCELEIQRIISKAGLIDIGQRRIIIPKRKKQVHSTKHTNINANEWVENIDQKAIKEIMFILGEEGKELISGVDLIIDNLSFRIGRTLNFGSIKDIKPQTEDPIKIPSFEFKTFYYNGKEYNIGNKPVTNEEYCLFLNECISQGINLPHIILHSDISSKEIYYDEKESIYKCNTDSKYRPVVYISILGAAIYAIYRNAYIPTVEFYQYLHKTFHKGEINGNTSETIPTTTISGTFNSSQGIYDLHGNIKELCLFVNNSGLIAYVYGGSYKDEDYIAKEGRISKIPYLISEEDVGFRLVNGNLSAGFNTTVFYLIKELEITRDKSILEKRYYDIIRKVAQTTLPAYN